MCSLSLELSAFRFKHSERTILKAGVSEQDTFFVGVTNQVAAGGLARLYERVVRPARDVYPTSRELMEFAEPVLKVLRGHRHVSGLTVGVALGRYGNAQELSLYLEVTASPDFAVQDLIEGVFRIAHNHFQTDAFVARVLHDDEWADNTRPGLTLLFKEPQRIRALRNLVDTVTGFPGDGWPIDGFTTVATTELPFGWAVGLRYVFLPEISIRWDRMLREQLLLDDTAMDVILLDQAFKIGRLCLALKEHPLIADARLNWFDAIVGGYDDYVELIARLDESRAAPMEGLMTRRAFSELIGLTNQGVLISRIKRLATSPQPIKSFGAVGE